MNGSLYMPYSGLSRSMNCGSVSDCADTMYLLQTQTAHKPSSMCKVGIQ